MRTAVYNAPHLMLNRKLLLLAIVLFLLRANAATNTWTKPVNQLAIQIAGITGPGNASITVRNVSSLGSEQVADIRRGLLAQLRVLGVRPVEANNAASEITVTLSENVESYLWVAEVRQGAGAAKVAMVSVPRSMSSTSAGPAPSLTIRKTLIWSQDDPILDVMLLDTGNIAVLDPLKVALYKTLSGRWEQEQMLSITRSSPMPRDPRGRLVLQRDHLFDIYLPKMVCSSSTSAPLTISCRESDDPWPLSAGEGSLSAFYGSSRNFFSGVLVGAKGTQYSTAAFYSAASIEKQGYMLWLFNGVDGKLRLTDFVNERTVAPGWGSDIASIRSACGTGTQILVTGNGDYSSADTIRAFEVPDREPISVSAAIDFSGPVTALWTATKGDSAVAVSRNLKTNKYEAFTLTVSCNQ